MSRLPTSRGVLLDTHVALWLLEAPDRLGPRATRLIGHSAAWVSSVSLWEIELKKSKGRLRMSFDLVDALRSSNIAELKTSWAHTAALPSVSLPHPDPFDHLLVAQAEHEELLLVTADRQILASANPRTVDARG